MRGKVISFIEIIRKVFNRASKDKKDFDGWNRLKKKLDNNKKDMSIKAGEIWWCSIGVNIDCEQNGKNQNYDRPVLIFRKLAKNKFYGIPLTTKKPRFDNYTYKFNYSNKPSYALLDQMRVFSINRLEERKSAGIDRKTYAIIKEKLGVILGYVRK